MKQEHGTCIMTAKLFSVTSFLFMSADHWPEPIPVPGVWRAFPYKHIAFFPYKNAGERRNGLASAFTLTRYDAIAEVRPTDLCQKNN